MKNNIDINYYKNGINNLAGTDESGRGSLAGPLVVASVILPKNYINPFINDSKKIQKNKLKILYDEITKNAIDFSIVVISNKEIEKLNPKKASIIGMERAINLLKVKPDYILTDAEKLNSKYKHESIIKGDSKSQTIAASSILAKVYRDNLMYNYDIKYPIYNFKNNKGYGTKEHIEKIIKNGVCKIHRKTYMPIKKILKFDKN